MIFYKNVGFSSVLRINTYLKELLRILDTIMLKFLPPVLFECVALKDKIENIFGYSFYPVGTLRYHCISF